MGIYNTSRYGQAEYGAQAEHPYLNTPGKLMWLVQIDWDRDGLFGSEIEPQTIVELKFSRGRKERILSNGQGQDHPAQETCWLVIYDPNARYDSFNQSSPLYNYLGASGILMRLIAVSTTDDTSSTVFVGTLASATYDVNTQRATLQGEGLARLLQIGEAEHLYNECQPTNQMNSAGWDSYFTLGVGTTPFPVNWWSGRDGGLFLRECVRLTLDAAGWSLGMYSGQANYNDDYPDFYFLNGDNAWNYLRDLADGFAARLFFLRDGRLFVMDRQDVLGLPGSSSVFGSPLLSYGLERENPYETLRNQAEVQVRPHDVPRPFGSFYDFQQTEVWSNAGPITVPPSSSQYFDIEYLHDGQVVAGNFLLANLSDFEAWSSPDKTGTDLVASGMAGVSVLFQANADGYQVVYGNNQSKARVRILNLDSTLTAYFFNVKMLMVGITETGNPATETASDANSIALNGRRILTINSPWVQRSNVAANVAQAYVDALADRQKASTVTLAYFLSGDALYEMLTGYDLGSIIDFGPVGGATALDNYGMYGKWLIVGLAFEWVNPDGQDAIVKASYEKMTARQVELAGAVSTTTANTSATPTWSHTVPSGLNRLLVVQVGLRAFRTVTSVTYNGVALTKLGAVQYSAGNFARAEIWYLVAPAVGTANVVVTISGAEVVEAAALNFVNVNQTTPMSTMGSNTGLGGSSAAVNITSQEGDLVLDMLVKEGGTLTPGTGQTSRWAASADGNWKGGGSTEVSDPSGTTNMSWSLTGANAWVLAGAAIKSLIN